MSRGFTRKVGPEGRPVVVRVYLEKNLGNVRSTLARNRARLRGESLFMLLRSSHLVRQPLANMTRWPRFSTFLAGLPTAFTYHHGDPVVVTSTVLAVP